MGNDILSGTSKGFYFIAKDFNLSWLRLAIFATYLSEDKSKRIVESFLLLSKDKGGKTSEIDIFTSVAGLPRIKNIEIKTLLIDVINHSLQTSQHQLADKNYYLKKSMPRYEIKDLESDLKNSSKYDIPRFDKFFKKDFKQIGVKTNCQKLREDIRKYVH